MRILRLALIKYTSASHLHDAEVGSEQPVDVAGRQEAADLAAAPACLPQLPRLQRHAALEQPCRRQRWLVWLQADVSMFAQHAKSSLTVETCSLTYAVHDSTGTM